MNVSGASPLVVAQGDHLATHVRLGAASFLSGCVCGWIGEPRVSYAAAVTDCLEHTRPFVPQVVRCSDPDCPIDARPVR